MCVFVFMHSGHSFSLNCRTSCSHMNKKQNENPLTRVSSRLSGSRTASPITMPSSTLSTGRPPSLSGLRSGGGYLGPYSTSWTNVAVCSTVTMATLPVHLCHHFVGNFVARPHVGPITAENQDEHKLMTLIHTICVCVCVCILTPPPGCTVRSPSCRDDNQASRRFQLHPQPHNSPSL